MKLTTEQLKAVLADISAALDANDSFEGTFSYTCLKDGLQKGEWEVSAAYRVGNSEGQGGMTFIPPAPPGQ